ncbi:MAG: hypothetical protein KAX20_08010 [Candidatus Omnitrophica bacterium]|nr:hypothetical protein [Candidatus Omnitrophota bacterium]
MYRTIDARFWTDPKVRELALKDKLLFLYFITSPHAHYSGLYYLPLVTLSYEIEIPEDEVVKGIDTLSKGYLVHADMASDLVWVVNMFRYQNRSPKLVTNLVSYLGKLHKSSLIPQFLEYYSDLEIPYRYPSDTVPSKDQYKRKKKDSMNHRVKDSKSPLSLSGKTPKQKEKAADALLKEKIWPRLKELQKKAKLSKKEIEEQLALEEQEAYLVDGLDTGRW